ncbi:MAG: histidine kinase [Planctomycetota bacterium]
MNPTDTESEVASVLFLSGDLIFASRVRSAAESAGLRFQISGQLPATEDLSILHVILDLSTRSSLLPQIVEDAASKTPRAKLIAYAPHVQTGRIAMAQDAGVPTVMTRGQFDASLQKLFR